MKILHVALGTPEFDRSATELGHEVRRIAWRQYLGRHGRGSNAALNKDIIRAAYTFRPDLVFCQLQTPDVVQRGTLDTMRELGCYVVNWCGDVRDPIPSWYVTDAPGFTVTAFSNQTDVDILTGMGHASKYLQIGYDETIYNVGRGRPRKREGIVFMGQNSGNRFPLSEARAEMVARMRAEFGDVFSVCGQGWGTKHVHAPEEVDIYRRSLIAINFDHFNRPYFASDRILRAQACGCCVVSMDYVGMEDEHPYVERVNTLDEMVGRCRELLLNTEVASSLGSLSSSHVRRHHTWHRRIEQIEEWMSEKS
jgi:glycosyltransferase involved in cell wall biosynthesis